LDMTIIKSFLVTQRSPLALLHSPWVFFSSSHSIRESKHFSSFSCPIKTLKRFDVFAQGILGSQTCVTRRSQYNGVPGGI
jgi:hypothetical protein